jgi:hypothetical protein
MYIFNYIYFYLTAIVALSSFVVAYPKIRVSHMCENLKLLGEKCSLYGEEYYLGYLKQFKDLNSSSCRNISALHICMTL